MKEMAWFDLPTRHGKASDLLGKRVRVNEMVQEPSPYRGMTGVVIGLQKNVEKTGETYPMCIVRLDKPFRACLTEVGFFPEALDEL